MSIKERILRPANLLFLLFFPILLLPDRTPGDYHDRLTAGLMILLEAFFLAVSLFVKKENFVRNAGKDIAVIFFIIDAWIVLSQKTELLSPKLFPPPGLVIYQLSDDLGELLLASGNSLRTVFTGFLLAAAVAIPMGLVLGWFKAVRHPAEFTIHFFSAIPPIIFIPYGIALLPTMRAASIFVIFIASYWPILSGTMNGVSNLDIGYQETARALNTGSADMIFRIIFPAALPYIFTGANQGLGLAFILLTSAEMIGADTEHPGIGYYIQNYANFGNFTRVILGIIFIGILISLISYGLNLLQRLLLRWKYA